MLVYQDATCGSVPLRSTSSFTTAASQTIDDEKDYIEILLTINNWHFDRTKWTEMNFEYVYLREPQAGTSADDVAPQDNPTANKDQTAAITAITNQIVQMQVQQGHIAQLLTQNSNPNPAPAQQTNPGVQNPNPIGTTANTGNVVGSISTYRYSKI